MARDLGPGLHGGHGQRRGAGDHVPELVVPQALLDRLDLVRRDLAQVLGEFHVDRRHGVEVRDVAGAEAAQAVASVEGRELDGRPVVHGRVEDVLDAVDVVEREDVQRVVLY